MERGRERLKCISGRRRGLFRYIRGTFARSSSCQVWHGLTVSLDLQVQGDTSYQEVLQGISYRSKQNFKTCYHLIKAPSRGGFYGWGMCCGASKAEERREGAEGRLPQLIYWIIICPLFSKEAKMGQKENLPSAAKHKAKFDF